MEPDLAAVPQQKIAAAPQILLRLLHCGAANTYDDLGLFWLYPVIFQAINFVS